MVFPTAVKSRVCFLSHSPHIPEPKDREVGFGASHCYLHTLLPPDPLKTTALWMLTPEDYTTLFLSGCYHQPPHYSCAERWSTELTLLPFTPTSVIILGDPNILVSEFLDLLISNDLFFNLPQFFLNEPGPYHHHFSGLHFHHHRIQSPVFFQTTFSSISPPIS